MHNNFKTTLNIFKNAIEKRKTLIKLKYSHETTLLVKFLRVNGYVSNYFWNKELNLLIIRLKYSLVNNSSISSFVTRNSKKKRKPTFFKRNSVDLQANFVKNILVNDKGSRFLARLR